MAGNHAASRRTELRAARLHIGMGHAGPDIIPPMKIFLLSIALASSTLAASKYMVYVGDYTSDKSKGVYSFHFDSSSGEMTTPALAAEVANPSFVAIHPNRKFLYAVSELGNDGKTNGAVTAFSIDAKS